MKSPDVTNHLVSMMPMLHIQVISYAGTSPEDFKKMSLDDRIKLKNSNPELYQQLRAK